MRPLDNLNNTVGTVRDFIPNWVENGVMAFVVSPLPHEVDDFGYLTRLTTSASARLH
jgi:hypothetical protein